MFKFLRDWFSWGSEIEPSGELAEHKDFILECVSSNVGAWFAYELGPDRLKSAREVCSLLGEDVSGFDSQIEFIEQTQHLVGWDLAGMQEHPDFSSWDQEQQDRQILRSDQEFLNNVYSTTWNSDVDRFYRDFSMLPEGHPKNIWQRKIRQSFLDFLESDFWKGIKKKI